MQSDYRQLPAGHVSCNLIKDFVTGNVSWNLITSKICLLQSDYRQLPTGNVSCNLITDSFELEMSH